MTGSVTLTEADVLGLLRAKLTKPGNGGAGEFALLAHVRNRAGFDARRTFDAVAVSLWPSRGFTLHCYEVKCSRSDWLSELKEPAKAEAAAEFCDHFSIVAAGPGIVRDGELPPTWGLLVVRGAALRTVVRAPLLPGADINRPLPRSVVVPMLRSAGAAVAVAPVELAAARTEGAKDALARYQAEARALGDELTRMRGAVGAFEDAAGVNLLAWSTDPGAVGTTVKAVLASERAEEVARERLSTLRAQLVEAVAAIDRAQPRPRTPQVPGERVATASVGGDGWVS